MNQSEPGPAVVTRRLPIRRTVPETLRTFFEAPFTFLLVAAAGMLGFRLVFASAVAIADQIVDDGPNLAWLMPMDLVVTYAFFIVCMSMLVVGAARLRHGERFAVMPAFSRSLSRLRSTLTVSLPILTTFGLFLYGTHPFTSLAWWLAAIVIGIVNVTVLAFSVPACVLEGLDPVASVRRSLDLTRGNRARLYLSWFVAALPFSVASSFLKTVTVPVFNEVAALIGFALPFACLSIHTVVAFNALTRAGSEEARGATP